MSCLFTEIFINSGVSYLYYDCQCLTSPTHEYIVPFSYLSRIVRKPDFCLGENKGTDQLRGNREADQRLCFRYSDSTIPLLLKSEISSFYLFSVLVQVGLCRTWSETPKTGFLASRPKFELFFCCQQDIGL